MNVSISIVLCASLLIGFVESCGSDRKKADSTRVNQPTANDSKKETEIKDPETEVESGKEVPVSNASANGPSLPEPFNFQFDGIDENGAVCSSRIDGLKTAAEFCVALQSAAQNLGCAEIERFAEFAKRCSSIGYSWYESTVCKIWARQTVHAAGSSVEDDRMMRTEYFCAGRKSNGQNIVEETFELKDVFQGLSIFGKVYSANHQRFGNPLMMNLQVLYPTDQASYRMEFRSLQRVDFDRTKDGFYYFGAQCNQVSSCDPADLQEESRVE